MEVFPVKVIKRDGHTVDFDRMKIVVAIQKANAAVDPEYRIDQERIDAIADAVGALHRPRLLVEDIQDMVERKLMESGKYELSKAYILYRYLRSLARKQNTTDESILSLLHNTNKEMAEENSNKDTTVEGQAFALEVMNHLNETVLRWRAETNIGFALYGTPAESLCYSFAEIDRERYGTVENVTDKGYYTNSYHVDVREDIDAFSKFQFESQFQSISKGGCISYVEVPNMSNNLTALEDVIHFIYDNIQYAEFNTKSDYCQVCGYEGEIRINDNLEWECPVCGNRDQRKMNVVRRTCGYLGENYWNVGKTKEIRSRVMHL